MLTKQLQKNAKPGTTDPTWDSLAVMTTAISHTQPWYQLTHKLLYSRNSKEGLASDKTQEKKFIDLFI